ncbi:MAG: DNA-binding response regulator [Candidatus Scalindua sp. AMX11]|nr:MAG: DNA-binding response regulator [Candidatus Scalindua sp.]NOG82623.1 response regulator transcription factor [Planctomycetota bacterium]RZV78303.1 MAG: response regulator transcription factor [Candidatus Scalindua sp. SCAELEC01]TDE65147.1 MAG: DNA-binding response regulator [Candidatus Scalindua sp. AMX11]GJQ59501.1 MAG: DNA-binding response regulator [Candidatus Scalindua sp.]
MKILIVEDEATLAKNLKKGFEENSFVVDLAYNGTDGLHQATHESYDIIILDIMLPQHDGLEILTRLRHDGIRTPVIFLTAKDSIEEKVNGLNSGADDYVIKPFSFHELLARVRVCLRRASHTTDVILKVNGLTLDPIVRKVFRDEKRVDLSPIEFSLLEYMMRHSGQVVTRTMISEHVWDSNFEGFSNVVDVHIAKLRIKIDKKHEKKLIHTVRGVGYVIEERD